MQTILNQSVYNLSNRDIWAECGNIIVIKLDRDGRPVDVEEADRELMINIVLRYARCFDFQFVFELILDQCVGNSQITYSSPVSWGASKPFKCLVTNVVRLAILDVPMYLFRNSL